MENSFELDPYPGKPKILFIGHSSSTHTHAWIDLLENSALNARLFGLPTGYPPADWKVKTYLTFPYLPEGLDMNIRQCFHLTHKKPLQLENEEALGLEKIIYSIALLLKKLKNKLISHFRKVLTDIDRDKEGYSFPAGDHHSSIDPPRIKAASPEAWLAQIIQKWRPDIVQTIGLDSAEFFLRARTQCMLDETGKWIVQLRGGSDMTLSRHHPEHCLQIAKTLEQCDQIISDNRENIMYASQMGISEDRFASIVPVPGTGGIDVDRLSKAWSKPPSQRSRIILWPKAYETKWSKALPVFEAIRISWDSIRPCEIYMTARIQEEIDLWFHALPDEIKEHCHLYDRLPRDRIIELMLQARVLLIPSLVDGVPNSMYEGMACGAFPIVSPIKTISSVVESRGNVLFARNLYPTEIAEALAEAMNNNALVDSAAQKNLELVRQLADRKSIGPRVINNYHELLHG